MDIPPEEGHLPEANHKPISLANLVLDEKYKNNGVQAILQLYRATGTTVVTPTGSVCYLDVGDDLESKAKQAIDSDSKTNIALVTQAFLDIKFSLNVHLKNKEARSRPLFCDLYYDSTSSDLIIRNRSVIGIKIRPISDSRADAEYDLDQLLPKQTKNLGPGTYRITIHKYRVLDLRVLARVDILDTTRKLASPGIPSVHGETSLKRALSVLEGELNESPTTPVRQIQKVGHAIDNSSILFLATGTNKISSSQSLVATGNPLVDLSQHGVLDIPGVLGVEGYQVHKRKVLSKRAQSEVYLAQYSAINDDEIVVKVLKIRSKTSTDNGRSPPDYTEAWLREYNVHNRLKHICIFNYKLRSFLVWLTASKESIVGLYSGDARFLTFYQEFAPGYDLSTEGVWRNATDDYFRGSEDNAF
jgi:hypothetical protein